MRALLAIAILSGASAAVAALVASADIVEFEADPVPASADAHFTDFRVGRTELSIVLDTYHDVTADVWSHHYSHVSGGDRTGTITLRDGRKLRWLVRPGGLARLTLPDGRTEYLVRDLPKT
jgi:hypothetical protein